MTKSQTRIKDFRQFDIITGESSEFVLLTIEETDDMFTFLYQVDKNYISGTILAVLEEMRN